jgi:hypothetical protein
MQDDALVKLKLEILCNRGTEISIHSFKRDACRWIHRAHIVMENSAWKWRVTVYRNKADKTLATCAQGNK